MRVGVASLAFALGVFGLFGLDRERNSRASGGLWIAVVWVLLAGSRMVSQWLQPGAIIIDSPEDYLDGSPLDRSILITLMVAGVVVLIGRGREVGAILRGNGALLVFFAYGAFSVFWADYSDVAFKRWSKAMGDMIMVMIVLTDPDRGSAARRFLARIGFVLVPLSILFIKYYPDLGRAYGRWDGNVVYVGAATDKNMLGVVCLVSGLGAAWRLIDALPWREGGREVRSLLAQGALLAMVLWLFWLANSMTSLSCFMLAVGVMGAASCPAVKRRRVLVHLLVAAVLCIALTALFFDTGSGLVEVMGRDSTLTGRTGVWETLLRLNQHPVFGAGFESFWLGPRLEELWAIYWWRPNQAHNGYLEVFLNLGLVGLGLFAVLLATGYRNVVAAFRSDSELGGLKLGFFVAGIMYSLTEAGFRTLNPIWIVFLLAIVAVPSAARAKARAASMGSVRLSATV